MSADPAAVRVTRRYRAAVFPRDVPTTKTRIEYDCSGRISAIDLKLRLEPQTGYLKRFRFRHLNGQSTTVAWEGVGVDGELVTGKILLYTAVAEDAVMGWGEVTVDG
jgi:hypothetical protein